MSGLSVVLAGLTLAAMLVLIAPLLRPRAAPSRRAFDLEVYRDQLAEIARDEASGLIAPKEAKAARIEVERRILHAARAEDTPVRATHRPTRFAAVGIVLALPIVVTALYLQLGQPHLPDQPLHARERPPEDPRLVQLVARLEAETARDPADRQAWMVLGRTLMALGRAGDAAQALRRAHALDPDDTAVAGLLAESLVHAAGGAVTPEAEALLRRVEAERPEAPEVLYYLGLADAQRGELQAALEAWRGVLIAAPANAPWRPQIEADFVAIADEIGYDGAAMLAALPVPQEDAAPRGGGPSVADIARAAEATAGMDANERRTMIENMVDGLAARLEQAPDDLDGWLRLARARLVLGEEDEAFALAPDDAGIVKSYAEARLASAGDESQAPRVGAEAAALFARAAELAPDDPEPLWFLGLHALQDGDPDTARARWRQVLALLDSDDPGYRAIEAQIEAITP